MNGNGVAANALEQRQILGGILSDVLDGAGTLVSQVGGGVTSVVGGVTSAVGGVLTPIIPPPSSTTITTTIPITTSATSTTPTVLTTTSTSATSSTSGRISSSSSSSSSSRPSSSSTTPTSTSESVFETTTNGQRHTVTSFVTGSASSPTSTPPPPPKSFLQNKPLSGFVFALCGIVGLVLIILITTFALRRTRRKKLEREAVSYDPGRGSYNDDMETRLVDEKGGGGDLLGPLARTGSQSSARTYGGSYATSHNTQHGYYDQRIPAYGQYPNCAPRSPNPFEQQQQQHQMYPNYAATANYPVAPLPPRSPNPAYDPNAGRLSPTELYRSNTRSSNNSDTGVQAPSTPLPPLPTSLLNGAGMKSPPPMAVSRVPAPAHLPATFGGDGSIDERQGIPPADLRVANQ